MYDNILKYQRKICNNDKLPIFRMFFTSISHDALSKDAVNECDYKESAESNKKEDESLMNVISGVKPDIYVGASCNNQSESLPKMGVYISSPDLERKLEKVHIYMSFILCLPFSFLW